jgi:biofilm PGA synthesis N-glycosyltransferase PgaC
MAEAWLFWLSVAWVGYVWVGYPLCLKALSLIHSFRHTPSEDYCPKVSVLIAARNEEKDIKWKLEQTLEWDYPADQLEVLVGSDASTDHTDSVIQAIPDPRLTFFRNPQRAGKNVTLNRLARQASGELFFFTDANTHIDSRCLKLIVRHFTDTRVGCVTGMESNLTDSQSSALSSGSNAYLGYESLIDRLESNLGSVLVCDGSAYCLRRELFSDLDPDLANDLEHPVRTGHGGAAILFEPQARSTERCSSSPREEFGRRRRIAAQGALAFWRLQGQLHGLRMWQFVSRKLLRWLTLLPMALALVASFLLRREHLFSLLFALQIAFYITALLGLWHVVYSRLNALLRLPFVFVLANVAVFAGVIDACRRKTFATWNIAQLSRGANS